MNRREALQRAGLVLGYAISAPTIAAVLNGCKAKPDLAFQPEFFNADQAGIVSELAEIIIPKTDTPGAKDAGVPKFIDILVKDCYKKEDQEAYLGGLAEFDRLAKETMGDSFMDLDLEKQVEYVTKVHKEAIEARRAAAQAAATAPKEKGEAGKKPDANEMARDFLMKTKELTVVGFFTSQPGATQVLQYQAVPGAYHGCVPLSEVGKAWAT